MFLEYGQAGSLLICLAPLHILQVYYLKDQYGVSRTYFHLIEGQES